MERTRQISHFKILTNDPSLTGWGWAVLDEKGNPIATGCIKTAPEQKKRRIRKGDDTIRRVKEINIELLEIVRRYNIRLILSELPHGSQNAAAAVMIGVVAGIIQTLADSFNIAIEWYSEQDAKKAVLHKKAATKEEMVDKVFPLYKLEPCGTKYIDEAVADALAIHYVANLQSPTLKMMKG